MTEQKEFREYRYLPKEDYDRTLKINGEKVPLYSEKQLEKLYPEKDYSVIGETFEKKKRDREKDTGRIELAGKWLYVSGTGTHSRLFRKPAAYAAAEGGGYIALLKLRLLPFLILLGLLLAGAGIALLPGRIPVSKENTVKPVDIEKEDPNMSVVAEVFYTISGTVTKDGKPIAGASLSLQKGSTEIAAVTAGEDGTYLFEGVSDGVYNVVCTAGDSVLTKLADVSGAGVTVDFRFPADDLHDVEEITGVHDREKLPVSGPEAGQSGTEAGAGEEESTGAPDEEKPTESGPAEVPGGTEATGRAEENTGAQGGENHSETEPEARETAVKAIVRVEENTPAVAVGGLETEAMLHMAVGKEVDITLRTRQVEETAVAAEAKAATEAISGELTMAWFDFSVLKEIFRNKQLESSEYLTNTRTVLEIAVPFDSSRAAGTYVFRYHGGRAQRFEQLAEKPAGAYKDGTCYATIDTVYIYTDCFSAYAIGYADAGTVTRGSDMLVFSDGAEVNVAEGTVTMYYSHDTGATHNARVEVYLKGRDSDLLLGQSGIIPPGNELKVMPLTAGAGQLPSDASYEGYMLIYYLDADGNAGDTNVELPVTVKITR